jgi:hypothetical protein
VVGDRERCGGKGSRDAAGERRDVLAQERAAGGDRARVARGVAVALLDLGRRDDDDVARPGDGRLWCAGDRPNRSCPTRDGLPCEGGRALVADRDEDVRGLMVAHRDVERVRRRADRTRCVVRGATAGEERRRAGGKPLLDLEHGEPRGLSGDRARGQSAGHGRIKARQGVSVR